jgi:hypothetical protein
MKVLHGIKRTRNGETSRSFVEKLPFYHLGMHAEAVMWGFRLPFIRPLLKLELPSIRLSIYFASVIGADSIQCAGLLRAIRTCEANPV